METVTVSPKYQVVLPKKARQLLGIKVGQKMVVMAYNNRIVLVPVLCIYEVFKKILQTQGQAVAEIRTADLLKGNVIDLTAPLAMSAALISVEHNLPMADSVILAVARQHRATLWTQDERFKGLDDVQYLEKSGK